MENTDNMNSPPQPSEKTEYRNTAAQDVSYPAVKKGEILEINTTRDITASEHDLKLRDAIKQYTTAVFWAMFFCIAVIMAGFDAQIVTSFYALPVSFSISDTSRHRNLKFAS
jgi:hypothetical protein